MKNFLPMVLGLALCLPLMGFVLIPNGHAEDNKVENKEEPKKGVALTDQLLNVSVTIVSQSENRFVRGGEGSGVIKTRKRGKETITFIWTAAHVVENLRNLKTVIDSKTGTSKTVAEFDWAKIVRSIVQNGETVGKSEMVVEVVRYSAEEDLALLRVRMKNYTNDSVQFYLDEKIPGVRTKLVHVGSLLGQLGGNSTTDGSLAFVGRMLNKKVYDQTTVTAFPGSCLPADMLVSMADGTTKRIVDVKPGDRVLSFGTVSGDTIKDNSHGFRSIRAGKVTALVEAGMKPIFTISTRNKTLRASGNHPVVKIHRVHDIAGKVHNIPSWTRVDQLVEGDVIATMKEHVEYKKSAGFNFAKEIGQYADRKKFMRFLGFYVGDGYKRERSGKGGELSLYTFEDEYTKKYAEILSETFGKNVSLHNNGNIVYTSNVKLVRDMDRWGFGGSAHTKKIPDWVFRLPRELQKEFFIGYVDADGTYKTSNTWALECCNENLIRQFRALAMNMGMGTSNITTRLKVVDLDGRKIASTSWMCEIYPNPKKEGADLTGDTSLLSDDLKYERISSISKGAEEPTYDITVDKMHNFFADGILVHNSGGGVYLDDDGRLVGLILRGAGETFNLMVPVRRMRAWAKSANVEWALDDNVALPSDEELKRLPVEDTGLIFGYHAVSSVKDGKTVRYGSGSKLYLGTDESRYPTLFKLNSEVLKMPSKE